MSTEKKRMIAVALLATILLTAFAIVRPMDRHGVPETKFWYDKFASPADFDVVVAGDSRILHGIDMQPFSDQGLGKGLNFGFQGAAANDEFVDASAARLNDRGKKVLVLGITPNGFTANSIATNGYKEKLREYKKTKFTLPNFLGAIVQRFRPLALADIRRMASGRKNPLQRIHHADGWVESRHAKPNEDSALRFYKVRFDGNPIQTNEIELTCETVKERVTDGVKVFGFKPPLSASMIELENEKSGFDYGDFVAKFSAAGGVWIEVDASQFKTYDGSHLESESATEFSSWLAAAIKSKLGEAN